jgi:hypothetical protein
MLYIYTKSYISNSNAQENLASVLAHAHVDGDVGASGGEGENV